MEYASFYDGYWYCYANSVAMLLGSFGYNIEPSTIEVLSGVSLGFFLSKSGLPFFSGFMGLPDKGISKALEILGFTCEEKAWKDADADPFKQLKSVLSYSPAALGPLDMSFLSYNPYRPNYPGVDHFVLAYKIEGDNVYVNDPAGYAQVYINREDLRKAWRAEAITYRNGYYRYWANPKRVTVPTNREIYQKAINYFKTIYSESDKVAKTLHVKIDEDVINFILNSIEADTLTETQVGFMIGFSLPLGAKRAYHYSQFFTPFHKELSDLKKQQMQLFGEAHSSLMFRQMKDLSKALRELAKTESQFRELLLKS